MIECVIMWWWWFKMLVSNAVQFYVVYNLVFLYCNDNTFRNNITKSFGTNFKEPYNDAHCEFPYKLQQFSFKWKIETEFIFINMYYLSNKINPLSCTLVFYRSRKLYHQISASFHLVIGKPKLIQQSRNYFRIRATINKY